MATWKRTGRRRLAAVGAALLAMAAVTPGGFSAAYASGDVGDGPQAGDDSATARSGPTAGEQVTIDAAANDTSPVGSPLSYSGPDGSPGGTVIVGPTGIIRYTPPPNVVGVDSFAYTVQDDAGRTATATVTVTVIADAAPTAADDTATVASQAGPGAVVSIPVLANDTDPDDALAYRDIVIVTQPANGWVTQSCIGACQPPDYQPNAGFTGTDSFTYRAVDPLGAQSDVATVTITVTSPDSTPPTVRPVLSAPAPGGDGWYNSPVTLTWAVSDDESAVTSTQGCDPVTVDRNQPLTAYTCRATSAGGTATGTTDIGFTDNFGGFLSPLPKTKQKAGSTIPVKFALTDHSGALVTTASVSARLGTGKPVACTYSTVTSAYACKVRMPSVAGSYRLWVSEQVGTDGSGAPVTAAVVDAPSVAGKPNANGETINVVR